MKTLLSTLALTTVLTSAALAGEPVASTDTARPGPVALTNAQMDAIVAGGSGAGSIDPGGGGSLYGGGAGVDPSVYGNGAGVDPSVYGGGSSGSGGGIEATLYHGGSLTGGGVDD